MTVRARISIVTLLAFLAAAGLSGCGVRGGLKPPPGEETVKTDHLPPEDSRHRSTILDRLVK